VEGMICFCELCDRTPPEGKKFCWPCWASLRDRGECPHGFLCDHPPCNKRVWIANDFRVIARHYAEIGHSDPDEDDEKFLRKLGLRRHPDRVSPLDSFDSA
jgi:hypothetical protein